MGVRRFAAAAMVGGLVLLTGCPFGGLEDVFSDGSVIQDGTYTGSMELTTTVREAGELYWDDIVDREHTATFSDGALLKSPGTWLEADDEDALDFGELQISRAVCCVDYGDWGYEVNYNLDAQWGDVPMIGNQSITYWTQPDGSLEVYDDIELFSLDSYDGGTWEYLISGFAVLTPDAAGDPLGDDILDLKSGKIRR